MRLLGVRPVAAVAISAALYYASTGLTGVSSAAWFAPLPVLLVAFTSSGRTAVLCSFAAYLLGSLNLYSYLAMVMPAPLVVVLLAARATMFALAVAAARWSLGRLPAWAAALTFPAVWTTYEFLLSLVSPHGTALSLAYSQTGFLPLLQIVSITGIWGVTFLVTLVPSALAVAFARRSARVLLPVAVLLVMVVGYGALRMQGAAGGPLVRVGMAATDRGLDEAFHAEDAAKAMSVARGYADRARRLVAQGAQVVIFPEKFVGVTPVDSAEVRRVFSETARGLRVTLIAGLNLAGSPPSRNVAVVFAPDGQLVAEYQKRHLLPGPETGYAVGTVPGIFHPPGVLWGVQICKDMDFPRWSREYARRGVRIMAVPAWDFVVDRRLHARMAVVRAVENGFTLARVAQQGLLTFSDAYGRILAETSSGNGPDALLTRDLGPGPGGTFYTRFGDWFGWCVVAAAAALVTISKTRPHAAERGSMTSKWSAPGNSTSRGGTGSPERAAR